MSFCKDAMSPYLGLDRWSVLHVEVGPDDLSNFDKLKLCLLVFKEFAKLFLALFVSPKMVLSRSNNMHPFTMIMSLKSAVPINPVLNRTTAGKGMNQGDDRMK